MKHEVGLEAGRSSCNNPQKKCKIKEQLAETGNSSGYGRKGMCVREHVKELPKIVK